MAYEEQALWTIPKESRINIDQRCNVQCIYYMTINYCALSCKAVIDLVGAPSSSELGFNVLAKGGKLVIVGLFGGASPWPLAFIPMRAISILGSYTGSLGELTDLLALVKSGKVKPIPVTEHPLDDASDVLHALHEGQVIGRAVLTD